MNRRCYFLMLAGFFAFTALWAFAQPPGDDLEQRRQQVEALRKHPEQLARLRENLNAYLALPRERRTAITKLQHDLDDAKDKRLLTTLERYADWLEQVRQQDPQAYQAIKDAPNSASRLALIRERRDREWMSQQPKALREKWETLKGDDRSKFVADLHRDARQKHAQWVIAQRFWKELEEKKPLPSRLTDFSPRVEEYITKYLMPKLTADEKKKLTSAEGRWPDYPISLLKVASKHPSALISERREEWPQKLSQLPEPVRIRLIETKKGIPNPKKLKELQQYEGPNFASKVVALGLRDNRFPLGHEYLAPNFKSLEEPMQTFVKEKLLGAIEKADNRADIRKLTDSEGKWPEYPLMIQELARKYDLQPPWHILPDQRTYHWDRYRDVKARSWGSDVAKEKK
jgi:hypothetical protein